LLVYETRESTFIRLYTNLPCDSVHVWIDGEFGEITMAM
jgi:hypothetical protein